MLSSTININVFTCIERLSTRNLKLFCKKKKTVNSIHLELISVKSSAAK